MENALLVLFYNTMFGFPLEYRTDELPAGCRITTDCTLLKQADAVVFHLPDLMEALKDDEIEKPEGQLWVAWSLECEVNYPWMEREDIRDLFDLWMGYHTGDDIAYGYCKYDYWEKLRQPLKQLPDQNKTCVFISSPYNESHRQEYLCELMRYAAIDSYGAFCNNRKLDIDAGRETLLEVIKDYKFVIAFENAIATDYVTEKFYNPLVAGTVPVYLGAPNVQDFAPGENCFVDVSLYESPQALAEFIDHCYEDHSFYCRFFEWRGKPLLKGYMERAERERGNPIVRLCLKLQQMKSKI